MSDNLSGGRDFGYHGQALDNIFGTYQELRSRCPVGRSETYGGFWFLLNSEDIFAAEQSPDTFSVAPSMLLPPMGTDVPLIPIDIDPHHQRAPVVTILSGALMDKAPGYSGGGAPGASIRACRAGR